MAEEWRDVVGYEGYYEVSNMGRVRSIGRYVKTAWGFRFKQPHIMSENIHPITGYHMVCLAKDGAKRTYMVHRLVAFAFIANPENKPQINHKNENKSDNRSANLEWMTAKENNNFGTKNERVSKANKTSKCKPVAQIKDGVVVEIFPSTISAKHIADPGHIGACALGKRLTAGGYAWKYV